MISFKRLYALLRKEWSQVTRDAITLRLIIALPMMQLFLFGYQLGLPFEVCHGLGQQGLGRNESGLGGVKRNLLHPRIDPR